MDIDEFVGLTRRWEVLDALREGPLDRRDLQERVGVSRPTIHRQVRSLEDSGLVTKQNGTFVLTPVGELAAVEFARMFEVMDTISALSRVLQWLPVAEFDFDVARLRDAEVSLPHPNDPFAPTRRMLRHIHGADHIRMVTYTFLPESDPATRQCFIEADQYFEGVLDPALVESILIDPAATAHLEDLLVQGSTIAVAADAVPLILIIADGTVILGAVDEGGCPQGLIVSDDEVIRRWAEETADSYLEEARQISPDDIGTRAVIADGGT